MDDIGRWKEQVKAELQALLDREGAAFRMVLLWHDSNQRVQLLAVDRQTLDLLNQERLGRVQGGIKEIFERWQRSHNHWHFALHGEVELALVADRQQWAGRWTVCIEPSQASGRKLRVH